MLFVCLFVYLLRVYLPCSFCLDGLLILFFAFFFFFFFFFFLRNALLDINKKKHAFSCNLCS